MNRNTIIGIIVAILIIGGAVVLANQSKDDENTQTPSNSLSADSESSNSNTTDTNTVAATASSTITYSDNGFSPATLTVASGTKVTIKNSSSNPLQFDSNPHPEHTDNPELNIGRINPGESQTITVTTKGSHGYHNHLNSGDTGTLVVN